MIHFTGMENEELIEMSNFTMGTISGMGFAQAQVHTNHITSAEEKNK